MALTSYFRFKHCSFTSSTSDFFAQQSAEYLSQTSHSENPLCCYKQTEESENADDCLNCQLTVIETECQVSILLKHTHTETKSHLPLIGLKIWRTKQIFLVFPNELSKSHVTKLLMPPQKLPTTFNPRKQSIFSTSGLSSGCKGVTNR